MSSMSSSTADELTVCDYHLAENFVHLNEMSFDDFLDTYLPAMSLNEEPPTLNKLSKEDAEHVLKSVSLGSDKHDIYQTMVSSFL